MEQDYIIWCYVIWEAIVQIFILKNVSKNKAVIKPFYRLVLDCGLFNICVIIKIRRIKFNWILLNWLPWLISGLDFLDNNLSKYCLDIINILVMVRLESWKTVLMAIRKWHSTYYWICFLLSKTLFRINISLPINYGERY